VNAQREFLSEQVLFKTCERALKKFEAKGAKIVNITIPFIGHLNKAHALTIAGEMATQMEKYWHVNQTICPFFVVVEFSSLFFYSISCTAKRIVRIGHSFELANYQGSSFD
jgi:Asp-tRNA(Asn)/Glu-tRNA(Gln) amidotransferase A subunit family amidase